MTQASLLCELIRAGLNGDTATFQRASEAISADERAKKHRQLSDRIDAILEEHQQAPKGYQTLGAGVQRSDFFQQKEPRHTIEELVLPEKVRKFIQELVEEQEDAAFLRDHGIEPRNKILLMGPPGNGKTTLAEAVAFSLKVPFYTVRYETLIGSYLGETAAQLDRLFSVAKYQPCVLFFDEFDTLGKERGDSQETGEIKRVVSSLLLQIDALPSHVVIVCATNHEDMLDRAAWRRFQLKLHLPNPEKTDIAEWLDRFERKMEFDLGYDTVELADLLTHRSFAEVEELATAVYRRFLVSRTAAKSKTLVAEQLELLAS